MPEYLVRNKEGTWEICHPAVFLLPTHRDIPQYVSDKRHVLAWADRRSALFCLSEDVDEVKELDDLVGEP